MKLGLLTLVLTLTLVSTARADLPVIVTPATASFTEGCDADACEIELFEVGETAFFQARFINTSDASVTVPFMALTMRLPGNNVAVLLNSFDDFELSPGLSDEESFLMTGSRTFSCDDLPSDGRDTRYELSGEYVNDEDEFVRGDINEFTVTDDDAGTCSGVPPGPPPVPEPPTPPTPPNPMPPFNPPATPSNPVVSGAGQTVYIVVREQPTTGAVRLSSSEAKTQATRALKFKFKTFRKGKNRRLSCESVTKAVKFCTVKWKYKSKKYRKNCTITETKKGYRVRVR